MADRGRLWERALVALRRKGLAVDPAATPASVAREAEVLLGDARPGTFVWGYHYPRLFGDTTGTLSDAEAEELIAGIEQGDDPAPDRSGGSGPCPVCGRDRAAEPGDDHE